MVFGTVWAVGVRDGSIRQRNQPVIVESACTPLDETGEQALRDAAIRLCSAVGYRGTGSAEFGIDPATRQFLFTDFRVQPPSGHLVTELTTGLDLAKLQLDIARGGQLSGGPPPARGHAIEVFLVAEDQNSLRRDARSGGRTATAIWRRDPRRRRRGGGRRDHGRVGSVIATVAAWGQDRSRGTESAAPRPDAVGRRG